jgi:hypothetical protein
MKTDKEIRQIVKDVYSGQVFATNDTNIINLSFMVFMLMDPEQAPKDVGLVYEYMSEAGPRSINGYPMFFSARYLTVEETQRFNKYYKEYEEIMKGWEA